MTQQTPAPVNPAHRAAQAQRTAESHAAFLLPHLRPGMRLLDLGCGPGTITVGLAAAVAPGETVGIDLNPGEPVGFTSVTGDVTELPFPDSSFDAIYAGALLQHLPEPAAALREARRVARPGAVIGLADADWDGELVYPSNDLLRRSTEIARRLRAGTSPTVGKQLRHLLVEAGFSQVVGSARVLEYGDQAATAGFGTFTAALFRYPALVERSAAEGWATTTELEEMSLAWQAWGEHPGAFVARFWCEATGWAD